MLLLNVKLKLLVKLWRNSSLLCCADAFIRMRECNCVRAHWYIFCSDNLHLQYNTACTVSLSIAELCLCQLLLESCYFLVKQENSLAVILVCCNQLIFGFDVLGHKLVNLNFATLVDVALIEKLVYDLLAVVFVDAFVS